MIIDKIIIRPNCVTGIKVPDQSEFLHFGRIKFNLYLWFSLEGERSISRKFLLAEDKRKIPPEIKLVYLDTLIRGNKAHHLFEIIPEENTDERERHEDNEGGIESSLSDESNLRSTNTADVEVPPA